MTKRIILLITYGVESDLFATMHHIQAFALIGKIPFTVLIKQQGYVDLAFIIGCPHCGVAEELILIFEMVEQTLGIRVFREGIHKVGCHRVFSQLTKQHCQASGPDIDHALQKLKVE